MPIFTRWSRASTFLIISARLSKNGTMVTVASDASFPRHTSTSWHWWPRRCGGFVIWVFVHDRCSHAGNCIGLLSNTGLFLFTVFKYLFLLQRRSFPFDSWPLLLFQFSRVWRHKFAIEVSDLFSSWPLSSIFDNWASISSDESPRRTTPIQFKVAQTHMSSIGTDFPRYHRMESLTLIVKLHPILCRIPEYIRHGEKQRINQRNQVLYHERQSLGK